MRFTYSAIFISFTKSSKLVVECAGKRLLLSVDLPVILDNIHLEEGTLVDIDVLVEQDRYFNTNLKCLNIKC